MYLTLGTAAKAVGKNKMAILRAIKNGRLSYVNKTKAGYEIDPAELFRVFPPVANNMLCYDDVSVTSDDTLQVSDTPVVTLVLQERLKYLELRISDRDRQLEELRTDRDYWRQQADYWRQQATGLLEDKRLQKGGLLRSLFQKKPTLEFNL
jgi:hypothetical protein